MLLISRGLNPSENRDKVLTLKRLSPVGGAAYGTPRNAQKVKFPSSVMDSMPPKDPEGVVTTSGSP